MLQNFQFSHLNLAAINHRLTVFMQQTVSDSVKKFMAHEIIYFRGFTEFSFVSSRRLSFAGCINNISLAFIRHKLSCLDFGRTQRKSFSESEFIFMKRLLSLLVSCVLLTWWKTNWNQYLSSLKTTFVWN